MEQGRHSTTAEGCAVLRAIHQITSAEPLVYDPISPRLVDPEGPAYKIWSDFLAGLPTENRLRLTHYLLRSRYAEDCLAEAYARGLRQYVILGAGLDTFAYRQPVWGGEVRIFEVDHPATQRWKRELLRKAQIQIPENAILVPVDFEIKTTKPALREAGLDQNSPAFVSMLGVSQYLTEQALAETLSMVREMGPSSEIVFSFVPPDNTLPEDEAVLTKQFAERFAAIGEPWLTRPLPIELQRTLKGMGFSIVSHLPPEEADQLYFRARTDGLRAPSMEQMMRAIV
jgi:methyltransferase (TIGR00027 family)